MNSKVYPRDEVCVNGILSLNYTAFSKDRKVKVSGRIFLQVLLRETLWPLCLSGNFLFFNHGDTENTKLHRETIIHNSQVFGFQNPT